jgi:hypothetical protein
LCPQDFARGEDCGAANSGCGSGGAGDGEAVFEHLEAGNMAGGNGEDDGEAGFDELAGGWQAGGEAAEDDGAVVAGEDVLDVEADAFGEGARVADEVGCSGTAFAAADPGERADVAGDLEVEVGAEELGDGLGGVTLAEAGEELLGDGVILLGAYEEVPG